MTEVLQRAGAGDSSAAARLAELVYERLRAMAGSCFRGVPPDQTLQPTALVHEAFIRMIGRADVEWRDRTHFYATCAVAMRGILADHARARRAAKRGGGWQRVTMSNVATPSLERQIDVLALDEALTRLEELQPRQARVVECRFFAGMTVPEVAEALGVSTTTVEGDWRMARAWLSARLSESGAS